ncbi:hypothetical protein DIPPA_21720, partial [Diplonema papillatum]
KVPPSRVTDLESEPHPSVAQPPSPVGTAAPPPAAQEIKPGRDPESPPGTHYDEAPPARVPHRARGGEKPSGGGGGGGEYSAAPFLPELPQARLKPLQPDGGGGAFRANRLLATALAAQQPLVWNTDVLNAKLQAHLQLAGAKPVRPPSHRRASRNPARRASHRLPALSVREGPVDYASPLDLAQQLRDKVRAT